MRITGLLLTLLALTVALLWVAWRILTGHTTPDGDCYGYWKLLGVIAGCIVVVVIACLSPPRT